LAYPIQKNTEGYYLQANFEIEGAKAPELEQAIDADQSIIRHLLVRDEIKPVVVEEAAE
jgi:ribosomal protein S6